MEKPLIAGLLLLAAAAGPKEEKSAVLWSRLRDRIAAVERGLDGVLGVSVRDLKTGEALDLRAQETFPTASAIKIAVLYELYREADEGRVDLGEASHPPKPRVGGGGILEFLSDGASLTLRDQAVLMMGWSDNDATNLLIDRLGMDAINRRVSGMGLLSTHLRRHMMDLDAARRGDENVSTPAELRSLMEALHEGRSLSRGGAKDLLDLARMPKDSPFRAALPPGTLVADKPGSLEGVRAVAAVVDLAERPYSVAIMTTYLRRDEDGEAAIRAISQALYETFDRLARASALGRIISDH
jgi:beta-lactamase class A